MAAVQGINPSVLVAPDYQTKMLEAQRRLDLATALRQQALTDTPGNGGRVSWTQGLARALAGLSAGMNAHSAYKEMKDANQAYAAGLRGMFGGGQTTPSTFGGGSQGQAGGAMSLAGDGSGAAPPNMPQLAQAAPPPFVPGQQPTAGQPDPLAALPDAPPQAASPQPPSAAPSASTGGAPGPFSLTGDQNRDMAMYVMNPDEYGKAVIGAHSPVDIAKTVQQAQEAMARGDVATATALLGNIEKNNYIPPAAARPGGWTQDPHTGQWMFHPQAPIPGAVPGPNDAKGNMTWQVPEGTEAAIAERARSQSTGEASGKAPYQFQQVYNQQTGQMEFKPVSEMAGSGALNSFYGHGSPQGGGPAPAPAQAPGGSHFPAAPPLGAQAAANTYGSGSANAFIETQGIANSSPQRVQSLREMEQLISGPNALATGPTRAKLQELATEHGLPFGFSDQGFVFNKDAARFVAQSAQDLGLNGSDARLGMMANASPNMKMTPQALNTVIPTMIGLEYAKMAKATAAANWAQHSPGTNAQFESQWRQAYDPRMFTAYAHGGPKALANAPANLRQQWLKDYRALKGMGVDFTQFAQ